MSNETGEQKGEVSNENENGQGANAKDDEGLDTRAPNLGSFFENLERKKNSSFLLK